MIGSATLLGLLGWAAWEASWEPHPEPPPQAEIATAEASSLEPLAFAPLSDYGLTLERPVFYEDRRLPETTEAEPADNVEPTAQLTSSGRLRLSAIIVENGQPSALLSIPGEPRSLRLREGESAGGWRLIEIHEDRVTVESNGRTEDIELHDFAVAPAPAPPPRRPPRRPPGVPTATPDR
jgi:general secretion pathway protein N